MKGIHCQDEDLLLEITGKTCRTITKVCFWKISLQRREIIIPDHLQIYTPFSPTDQAWLQHHSFICVSGYFCLLDNKEFDVTTQKFPIKTLFGEIHHVNQINAAGALNADEQMSRGFKKHKKNPTWHKSVTMPTKNPSDKTKRKKALNRTLTLHFFNAWFRVLFVLICPVTAPHLIKV